MNEDELARLLRATPGEPELPADPVAVVRRRAGQVRRRKQLVAGGLAAVLVAAAGGAVVGAPGGHSSGGTAVLREATDPPTVSPTDPAPSASPSASPTALTTTVAAAVADTSPLHFTWHTRVVGTTVTLDGEWSGTGPTVTAADIASTVAPTASLQVGSGVEGWQAYSEIWPLIWTTNGGEPTTCTGPVEEQHRTLPTQTYTNVPQGTYTLTMNSGLCGSPEGRIDTTTITVGPGATPTPPPPSYLGFGGITVEPTTVEAGSPLRYTANFLGFPGDYVIDFVGASGPVGRFPGESGGSCSTQSSPEAQWLVKTDFTFEDPGRYAILFRWSCDTFPAETGPMVKEEGGPNGPGPVPGFGGNLQDAEQLAKDDPVHNLVVLITVVPGPSGSASSSPSASGSATATSTATTPAKPAETPTATPSS